MQVLKQEIRIKFLEAAKTEFIRYGYQGTSMRNIARWTEFTVGNIYRYWPSKEKLFGDVLDEVNDHTALVLQAGRILSKYGSLNRYLMDLPDIDLIRLMQGAYQRDGVAAAKDVF